MFHVKHHGSNVVTSFLTRVDNTRRHMCVSRETPRFHSQGFTASPPVTVTLLMLHGLTATVSRLYHQSLTAPRPTRIRAYEGGVLAHPTTHMRMEPSRLISIIPDCSHTPRIHPTRPRNPHARSPSSRATRICHPQSGHGASPCCRNLIIGAHIAHNQTYERITDAFMKIVRMLIARSIIVCIIIMRSIIARIITAPQHA